MGVGPPSGPVLIYSAVEFGSGLGSEEVGSKTRTHREACWGG